MYRKNSDISNPKQCSCVGFFRGFLPGASILSMCKTRAALLISRLEINSFKDPDWKPKIDRATAQKLNYVKVWMLSKLSKENL